MSFEYELLELDSDDLIRNISYLEEKNRRFDVGISWSIDRERDIFLRVIKINRGSNRTILAMQRNGVELLFATFQVEIRTHVSGTRKETMAVFYDIPPEFEESIDEIKADFIESYKALTYNGVYSKSQRPDDFTLTITQFEKSPVDLWTV